MLTLTLRPGERVVINGCVLRAGDRRQSIHVENRADIIRERDIIKEDAASTPVSRVYFLVQTAILSPETREKLCPEIRKRLADLMVCFGSEVRTALMRCASHISSLEFYRALSELRAIRRYEAELLGLRTGLAEHA